jgi:ribosomal peptide maturation radical SAM protein 1
VQSDYGTFAFAKVIGEDFYSEIASGYPLNHDLAGEFIFSKAAFPAHGGNENDYVTAILMGEDRCHVKRGRAKKMVTPDFISKILNARELAVEFVQSYVDRLLELRPRIVGLTSVFQQHTAALAIARLLKSRREDLFIVFGGANCEADMGLEIMDQCEYIDAVVSGEGDLVFPELVRRMLSNEATNDLGGVFRRNHSGGHIERTKSVAESVMEMDDLPFPDYSDYISQWQLFDSKSGIEPRLLFETARGCWWGEKKHCTFCGLNGSTMKFRSKTPERALREIEHLHSVCPRAAISVVDNIIDYRYFDTFLPLLAKRNLPIELFYEVKSNLAKEQVQLLAAAKITRIQPGIESLSDQVLSVMKKGVTGFQNIQLLKWCEEFGIIAEWNVLWGFPDEDPKEYDWMSGIIPALTHLRPPGSASSIRLDRFSPNFLHASEVGLCDVKPYPSYHHVYPFSHTSLNRLAYYFSFNYEPPRHVAGYVKKCADEIRSWMEKYDESAAFYLDGGSELFVFDCRPAASSACFKLQGLAREIFRACDRTRSIESLRRHLTNSGCGDDLNQFDSILETLVKAKLIIERTGRILTLVPALTVYSDPERWKALGKALETRTGKPLQSPDGEIHIPLDSVVVIGENSRALVADVQ